jgi:hypothetical protein
MSETFLLAAAARAADTVATVGNDDSSLTLPPIDMVPANVHVEHKPGRGRYLTLKRAAAAGACLLAEAPVCWWVDVDRQDECCARCLKCDIPFGGHTGCTVCRTAVWCSEECRAEDAARHASVCPLLSAAAKHKDADGTSQLDSNTANLLHFCAHAVALRNDKPTDFEQLWWLSSVGVQLTDAEKQACVRVADRLKAAGVLSTPAEPMLAFVTELCKKDKASNFCLAMPPSSKNDDDDDSDDDDSDDDDSDDDDNDDDARPARGQGADSDGEKEDADGEFPIAASGGDDDSDDSDDGDDDEVHLDGGWAMATRRVRGYGCYPMLAFCNHSCLPTAARFDALDDTDPENLNPVLAASLPAAACGGALASAVAEEGGDTAALLRPPFSLTTRLVALHALPAGSEVSISYMPLGDPLILRSERLEDEYGFECDCTRCVVERAEEEEGLDGDDEVALADTGEVDVTYISLFILKHVCGACLGTMAPLPPAGTICVCNRCGESRTEAQFLERVQEHMDGDDDDD